MEPAGAALPEVLVLSDAAEQLDDRSGRSRSVPLERELRALEGEMPRDLRRQRSHLAREVPVPPVQLPVSGRTLGRHVSLGPGWELNKEGEIMYPSQPSTSHSPEVDPLEAQVPAQYQGQGRQERVRCHAVAEGFDRYALQDAILRREGSLQAYAEVLISEFHRAGDDSAGHVFYFDFGVLVFWGLSKDIERYILREVVDACMTGPLPADVREVDRLRVVYSTAPKHHIENDSLALHYRRAGRTAASAGLQGS
ncbi:hypothetical protein CHLNCDRAFT_137677 [Chlorella variabilis]|uniref:DUF155 domain-containing protein n=1 Tax=Chlorella variabilis TaxID=554065 RepID=E1Z489_CHLVA|nr:hypothetical protein CHLNCDRAFT_137677 [Chlorella variabilis]EFN59010.1 hypothetical protein CHLNCDRAFT_137677 [Chlorella variabilis]|eukprot:XP_005851112.1 hypothetical protein CHLNCDRAFT_137677 [Chlorella variabilis]